MLVAVLRRVLYFGSVDMDAASSSSNPKGVRARADAPQIARSRFAIRRGELPENAGIELAQRGNKLRLLLAALVIAAWVFMAARYGVNAWLHAPSGPLSASSSPNAAFTGLLDTANNVCPATKDYFLVSDDVSVYQLADYHMYPRRAIRLTPTGPLGSATLAGRKGDCMIAYGAENLARVQPLIPQLNLIDCAANDRSCLYVIK
jgi:hypothetical protein